MRKKVQVEKEHKGAFSSMRDLLLEYDFDKKKYISQEFQDYGYRLAMELQDPKNKSLYIKLAKTEKRALLEEARTFIKDANKVRSKAKLFMWALAKLKKGEPLYDEDEIRSYERDRDKAGGV